MHLGSRHASRSASEESLRRGRGAVELKHSAAFATGDACHLLAEVRHWLAGLLPPKVVEQLVELGWFVAAGGPARVDCRRTVRDPVW